MKSKGSILFNFLFDFLMVVGTLAILVSLVIPVYLGSQEKQKLNVIVEKRINNERFSREEWDEYKDNKFDINARVKELKEEKKSEKVKKEEKDREYKEYLNSFEAQVP